MSRSMIYVGQQHIKCICGIMEPAGGDNRGIVVAWGNCSVGGVSPRISNGQHLELTRKAFRKVRNSPSVM